MKLTRREKRRKARKESILSMRKARIRQSALSLHAAVHATSEALRDPPLHAPLLTGYLAVT